MPFICVAIAVRLGPLSMARSSSFDVGRRGLAAEFEEMEVEEGKG